MCLEKLEKEIKILQASLYKKGKSVYKLSEEKIVRLSQELDSKILEYQKKLLEK